MGEDVVPDELTEEQHQIHKFHLLTFTVWIRCEETNSVKNQFPQLDRGKKHKKTMTNLNDIFTIFYFSFNKIRDLLENYEALAFCTEPAHQVFCLFCFKFLLFYFF